MIAMYMYAKPLRRSDRKTETPGLENLAQEAFLAVSLNQKNSIMDMHLVSLGTLTGSLVHPREVFRPILLDGAAAVGFVHNHPSGNPDPSRDDREITARLIECAKLLGIRVLDHVIIGRNGYFSFSEEGLI
jgi:DNA repair protein RadC